MLYIPTNGHNVLTLTDRLRAQETFLSLVKAFFLTGVANTLRGSAGLTLALRSQWEVTIAKASRNK